MSFSFKFKYCLIINSTRKIYLLINLFNLCSCTLTSGTRICYFFTFTITRITNGSQNHWALSHCHVSTALTSTTLLRLSPWFWFASFACTACTFSIKFDCLIYSIYTFFIPFTASVKSSSTLETIFSGPFYRFWDWPWKPNKS